MSGDTTVVSFDLMGNVDVHSFREEKTYIVDIGFEPAEKSKVTQDDEAARVAAKLAGPPRPAKGTAPASAALAPAATNAQPQEPPKPMPAATSAAPANPGPVPPVASNAQAPEAAKPQAPARASADHVAADTAPAAKEEPAPAASTPPIEAKPSRPQPVLAAAPVVEEKPVAADRGAVAIQAKRSAGNLHLFVPFAEPTAAAVFSRDDAVWLVFDGDAPLNTAQLSKESAGLVLDVAQVAAADGRAIRLRLSRPQLAGVSIDGNAWIVDISDASQSSPEPLATVRNIADRTRATISIPFVGASRLLKFADPDTGDVVMAVTAPPPIKGFVKQQTFVDFALLASAQGVIVRPNSDDLRIELAADKITLGRPGGLTLSAAENSAGRSTAAVRPIFDLATWKMDREQNFAKRLDTLTSAAAMSTGDRRLATHIDLARFYFSRGFYREARGVLDALFAEAKPGADDVVALVLHAVANILSGNANDGLAELNNPVIGAGYDSQLWKAVAYARQRNWGTAREQFKGVEFAIGGLPVELQRVVIVDEIRAALETRDFGGVSSRLSDLDLIGVPQDLQPSLAVLRGRMDEALGKDKDALSDYQLAIASSDSPSAAEARIDEIALRQRRKEIAPDEALASLETLSMTWRGDLIEIRTLQQLSRFYADLGRYRDAFVASRAATKIQPNSEPSRQMQDATAALFSEIFLGPKGDDLPPVDALALFYEFSELTPIGRRGDELIRKLADRLVSVDLLDQAGELLQYQIDQRLDGAARAQVASRLAMVYLMNRKPDRAISVLRATRIGDLASELRTQRLLIEARAQSDIGRHDLAIDIISNISGREAIRLRSDIYWAARRWRESSEQIELLYGDRWRDFQPLTPEEKADIIRAGIGYALAADTIGIARLREKYAAKMESAADKTVFDAATNGNSSEFTAIAKMAASVDTLDGFVRDMKVRFPEVASRQPLPDEVKADPYATGSLPAIKGLRPAPSL
jgi:tetratricopeptide (TPR) repeat protein